MAWPELEPCSLNSLKVPFLHNVLVAEPAYSNYAVNVVNFDQHDRDAVETWFFEEAMAEDHFRVMFDNPAIGDESPCVCGSGKQFSDCCEWGPRTFKEEAPFQKKYNVCGGTVCINPNCVCDEGDKDDEHPHNTYFVKQ